MQVISLFPLQKPESAGIKRPFKRYFEGIVNGVESNWIFDIAKGSEWPEQYRGIREI
jgi:hypothetical protein